MDEKRDVNYFVIIMPKDILRKDFNDLTNFNKCFRGEQGG